MAGKRGLDRVQLISGMLLGVTALCSLMLTLAAGTSAVATFAGKQAAVLAEEGSLHGLTIGFSDLRGMIVTEEQAAELALLLGLEIRR